MFMFVYVDIIKIHLHICHAHLMFLLLNLVLLFFESHNLILFLVWKLDLNLSFSLYFRGFSCPWHRMLWVSSSWNCSPIMVWPKVIMFSTTTSFSFFLVLYFFLASSSTIAIVLGTHALEAICLGSFLHSLNALEDFPINLRNLLWYQISHSNTHGHGSIVAFVLFTCRHKTSTLPTHEKPCIWWSYSI